jgi:hypothetical protein
MHSQFDDPLPMKSANTIRAKGPLLDWRSSDPRHCKITAVLTQGSEPNTVTGTCNTGNYNHGDDRWECDVTAAGGKVWDAALPVHCVGTITPPGTDWVQDVSLTAP